MPQYFDDDPGLAHDEREITATALGHTLRFTTDAGVFSKNGLDYGTRLMLEAMPPVTGRMLDLGCGWGAVGAFVAAANPLARVELCDINPRAVALAARNLQRNGLNNATAVHSDGLGALEGVFDLIALNPPIRAGKTVVYALFEQAHGALAPGGLLFVVLQVKQGAPSAKVNLEARFGAGRVQTVARGAGYHVLKCEKK